MALFEPWDRGVELHEEMHLSERWQEFAAYPDAASAEVAAGLLRSEGVPVDIASDEPMLGLIHGFRLMVPADMFRRARWVVSNADFSEEELAFFATGRLDSSESTTAAERDARQTRAADARKP